MWNLGRGTGTYARTQSHTHGRVQTPTNANVVTYVKIQYTYEFKMLTHVDMI